MAKIAIITDIHANLHALELVLKDIEKKGVDQIICLGDIVSKYYYPKEAVDLVRDCASIVIMGNCDEHIATEVYKDADGRPIVDHLDPNGRPIYKYKYRWARGLLGEERIEYLKNLDVEAQISVGKALVSLHHANPRNPSDLDAMFNPLFKGNEKGNYKDKIITDYREMLPKDDKPGVTIVGHTHQAYIGVEQDGEFVIDENPEEGRIILPGDRAIMNAGSAGELNSYRLNGDKVEGTILPYLTYILLDDANLEEGFHARVVRVPYQEGIKQVFFDSISNQKRGLFPYSPGDTRRIADSIIAQNPGDEELRQELERKQEENNAVEQVRRTMR